MDSRIEPQPTFEQAAAALRDSFAPMFAARDAAYTAVLAGLKAKFGVDLIVYTTAAPLQITGTTRDGKHLYFRARWESWAFSVAETETANYDEKPLFYRDGETQGFGSWLDAEESQVILSACLQEYANA